MFFANKKDNSATNSDEHFVAASGCSFSKKWVDYQKHVGTSFYIEYLTWQQNAGKTLKNHTGRLKFRTQGGKLPLEECVNHLWLGINSDNTYKGAKDKPIQGFYCL